jgi:hypothetical protein
MADDIALAFSPFSLIAVFVMVLRQHKRHLPKQDAEEC